MVSALHAVAAPLGVEFFLMGAAARDLILRYAHGIEASRATEDVDFAVMVRDWQAYDALRTALIASGEFSARPGPATHRLRHTSGLPLDIVPFGGVEQADRTFGWPPEHSTVFDCSAWPKRSRQASWCVCLMRCSSRWRQSQLRSC